MALSLQLVVHKNITATKYFSFVTVVTAKTIVNY